MPAHDAAAALLPLPSRTQRGYNSDWLGNTFSQAVFLGNGLMAILAGTMPRPQRQLALNIQALGQPAKPLWYTPPAAGRVACAQKST